MHLDAILLLLLPANLSSQRQCRHLFFKSLLRRKDPYVMATKKWGTCFVRLCTRLIGRMERSGRAGGDAAL